MLKKFVHVLQTISYQMRVVKSISPNIDLSIKFALNWHSATLCGGLGHRLGVRSAGAVGREVMRAGAAARPERRGGSIKLSLAGEASCCSSRSRDWLPMLAPSRLGRAGGKMHNVSLLPSLSPLFWSSVFPLSKIFISSCTCKCNVYFFLSH